MKKFKKFVGENYFLIFYFSCVIAFSFLYPDVKMSASGGWAWMIMFGIAFIITAWLTTSILGGIISYEAEGLIPKLKRWFKKN